MQANRWALRALKALNLKPISPATPGPDIATPAQCTPEVQSLPDARSPFFFSPWAFPPISLAKVCSRGPCCVKDESLGMPCQALGKWMLMSESRGYAKHQDLSCQWRLQAPLYTLHAVLCLAHAGKPLHSAAWLPAPHLHELRQDVA